MFSLASFAIAIVSLVVTILAFMLDGNRGNKTARVFLGVGFLLLTVLFTLLGVFSFIGNNGLQPPGTFTPYCAFVTSDQVEQLKNTQGVQNAITQAEVFSGHTQNNYSQGSTIPQGVMIATDLRSTNLNQFGVVPVNNQGGWGLFITTREFSAPNDGTYWCIH